MQSGAGMFGSGLGGFLGGMFGDSGGPYEDAANQYKKWTQKGVDAQNPFYNAGTAATGNLQDWLGGMKDPSGFINQLMGKYQESPWAKFQQQQSSRAGTNAASASGLTGSSPFAQQMQQNSSNISSQDMQNWLANVLGINSQYGAGNEFLSGQGAGAANQISGLYGNNAGRMGEAAYGQKAGENQDFWNMVGGGAQMAGSFFI